MPKLAEMTKDEPPLRVLTASNHRLETMAQSCQGNQHAMITEPAISPEKLAVDYWNATFPPGTRVNVLSTDGTHLTAKTTSTAKIVNGRPIVAIDKEPNEVSLWNVRRL